MESIKKVNVENCMNKIAFIIPYFGKFNNYFDIFLKSCGENKKVCDWIIFTDDRTLYKYPSNVKVHYLSWNKMQKYFQNKFDFKIALEKPYKLCDFKVTYGYVFESYLDGYEFWGHCDVDLIWGNFEHFLTDKILNSYDKIFNLGHCTLYRNKKENNVRFFHELNGEKRYLEVLTNPQNYSFDEEYKKSINSIYEELGIPVYENSFAANVYTKSSNFKLTSLNITHDEYSVEKRVSNFFVWTKGNLYRYTVEDNGLKRKEYLYVHFQSRKMEKKADITGYSEFKIIPNAFEKLEVRSDRISSDNFKRIKMKNFNLHYFKLRSKNLLIKLKKRMKRGY